MQESDGNPHITRVINWNVLRFVHIDAVVIVVFGVFVFVIPVPFGERQILMPLTIFKVSESQAVV